MYYWKKNENEALDPVAYPQRVCSMRRLGVFLLPLDAVHSPAPGTSALTMRPPRLPKYVLLLIQIKFKFRRHLGKGFVKSE